MWVQNNWEIFWFTKKDSKIVYLSFWGLFFSGIVLAVVRLGRVVMPVEWVPAELELIVYLDWHLKSAKDLVAWVYLFPLSSILWLSFKVHFRHFDFFIVSFEKEWSTRGWGNHLSIGILPQITEKSIHVITSGQKEQKWRNTLSMSNWCKQSWTFLVCTPLSSLSRLFFLIFSGVFMFGYGKDGTLKCHKPTLGLYVAASIADEVLCLLSCVPFFVSFLGTEVCWKALRSVHAQQSCPRLSMHLTVASLSAPPPFELLSRQNCFIS